MRSSALHQLLAALVDRHDMFTDVTYSENNHDMYDSYITVSPQGQFFQNSLSTAEHPYTYSRPTPTGLYKSGLFRHRF